MKQNCKKNRFRFPWQRPKNAKNCRLLHAQIKINTINIILKTCFVC
jgi:hypothetical protein